MWKSLAWPHHFTKRGGQSHKTSLTRHFLLKCLFQESDRVVMYLCVRATDLLRPGKWVVMYLCVTVRATDLLRPGKWVVMYLCVRATDLQRPGKWVVMYLCVRATDLLRPGKWVVMYLCVRTTDLLRPGKWVVMYLCVRATDFASTLLMFDFGIVSTVCYFCFSFYHFISSPDLKVMWAIAITWRPSSLSIVRRKLFQKSSPLKVLDQWKPNLVRIITRVSSFKIVSGDAIHQPTWPLFLKIEQTLYGKIAGFG
jgi:hypothetical protein